MNSKKLETAKGVFMRLAGYEEFDAEAAMRWLKLSAEQYGLIAYIAECVRLRAAFEEINPAQDIGRYDDVYDGVNHADDIACLRRAIKGET